MNVSGRNNPPNVPLRIYRSKDRLSSWARSVITSIGKNPQREGQIDLFQTETYSAEDAILKIDLDAPRNVLDPVPMINLAEVDANLQSIICGSAFPVLGVLRAQARSGFAYPLDLLWIVPKVQLLKNKARVSLAPKTRATAKRGKTLYPVISETVFFEDGSPEVFSYLVAGLFQRL